MCPLLFLFNPGSPKKPLNLSKLGLNLIWFYSNVYGALFMKRDGLASWKTSLLHRLKAQTLPDEAPLIGKINPFSKMAVNFEPLMGF